MRLEARRYLYDIQHAVGLILDPTEVKMFTDFEGDAMLRSGNEVRRFRLNQMGGCPKRNSWIAYFEITVTMSISWKIV